MFPEVLKNQEMLSWKFGLPGHGSDPASSAWRSRVSLDNGRDTDCGFLSLDRHGPVIPNEVFPKCRLQGRATGSILTFKGVRQQSSRLKACCDFVALFLTVLVLYVAHGRSVEERDVSKKGDGMVSV
jgi:hypothetical protein